MYLAGEDIVYCSRARRLAGRALAAGAKVLRP
jgi:hypothetical protein